jgi:hypothetical protein
MTQISTAHTTERPPSSEESAGGPVQAVDSSPLLPGGRNPDWGAPILVWASWAGLLLAVLFFIRNYAFNVPGYDEWHWAPVMCGEQPLTADALWEKFSEHRHPLTRLILFAVAQATDCDFRACMYVSAFLLGGLACGMIVMARRLRGSTSYADLFFPLALLHFGHVENLLQGWNVNQILATCLACVPLLIIAQDRKASLGHALVAGFCLFLLPMCGAYGLALVPALALWLIFSGILMWRSPSGRGKRNGAMVLGVALVALLLVPLYLLPSLPGIYQELDDLPSYSGDLLTSLRGSIEFLASGFGPALWASLLQIVGGLGAYALLLFSGIVLVVIWWRQPQERYRAVGFLCFLGAIACLTLGIGWGRGANPGECFKSRYAVSAVPALCCVYLAGVIYYPATSGRLVQMVLFVFMGMVFQENWQEGLHWGKGIYDKKQALANELQAGMPADMLAQRHTATLNLSWSGKVFPELVDQTAAGIRALARARIGVFKDLQPDPPSRAERFPIVPIAMYKPVEINQMTWREKGGIGVGKVEGDEPSLVWALKQPQFVHAIRIQCAYEKAGARAAFRLFWRKRSENDFTKDERNAKLALKADAEEKTVTVWVNEEIDSFRIDPDHEPCVFKVSAIFLLFPSDSAYARMVEQIHQAVERTLPPDATVLVVSKGDGELLRFGRRTGRHFPGAADQSWAGHPADSAQAIAELKKEQARGAQFLLIPQPYFWWLDEYADLRRYLEEHGALLHRDDYCIIFRIIRPKGG